MFLENIKSESVHAGKIFLRREGDGQEKKFTGSSCVTKLINFKKTASCPRGMDSDNFFTVITNYCLVN